MPVFYHAASPREFEEMLLSGLIPRLWHIDEAAALRTRLRSQARQLQLSLSDGKQPMSTMFERKRTGEMLRHEVQCDVLTEKKFVLMEMTCDTQKAFEAGKVELLDCGDVKFRSEPRVDECPGFLDFFQGALEQVRGHVRLSAAN